MTPSGSLTGAMAAGKIVIGTDRTWLSENILGIQPAAPGFKEITIKPNLGDLSFAKGSVPTPLGLITVTHERRKDGTITSKHNIPAGVKIV